MCSTSKEMITQDSAVLLRRIVTPLSGSYNRVFDAVLRESGIVDEVNSHKGHKQPKEGVEHKNVVSVRGTKP